jgi:hypothetical protein
MKFTDFVSLRKKYSDYIFNLCITHFETPHVFAEEELILKKHMDYDWLLQTQSARINNQANLLNQRVREFSKLTQVDKRAMNELMELKIILKNQKKEMEILQEKNHQEIKESYTSILLQLCTKIFNKIKEEPLLHKMQLAIKKTEKHFMKYCFDWKLDKKNYYNDVQEQTSLIIKISNQITEEIQNFFKNEQSSLFPQNKTQDLHVKMQSSKIGANCTNLAHYVDNFKSFYPETLLFKDGILTKIDLKESFKDFSQISMGQMAKVEDTKKLKENLNTALIEIKKIQEIFYGIYEKNRKYLIHLDVERKKMSKIAITEFELTQMTIIQWLEYDPNSIFFLFSEYLKEHKFS